MTSVVGHLTGLDFERQYKGWLSCPPGSLFEAPVKEDVDKVGLPFPATVLSCLPNALPGQAADCRKHPEPSKIQQSPVHLDRL